ncbi:hypothetical protein [Streptosporangium vulgare]|uniref:hypothetical protein n=1 Tax=Streptosporangium vulgare TaxID=46190 RepID=UPI0031D8CACD
MALAATFLAYGLTELVHGYGFIAVFVTRLHHQGRRAQPRLQRGAARFHRADSSGCSPPGSSCCSAASCAVGRPGRAHPGGRRGRPSAAAGHPAADRVARRAGRHAGPRERVATAFFGIRGIGSLFYPRLRPRPGRLRRPAEELWAVVAFTVLASLAIHGISASP